MKAAELRQSILRAAVQGKLVPQNPQDEPASELLNRIQQEKAQLIKEGKLKKEKTIPPITKDEIPYDLPEGWEWCRFGNLVYNRDSERIPVSQVEREKRQKLYNYYGASGIIDKIDNFLFNKTLLLIGEDGANLLARSTPIAFLANGKYWVNNHAHVLDGISTQLLEYLALYINAIDLSPYITGTAQPKMNQERMNSIPVAVPSESEQKRIIARVNKLMLLCNELEAEDQKLDALEAHFSEYLPKAILQAAVQGKLVPQNSHDEPASELLKRIQQEKAQLVKEGNLKKEKLLPPISEDELPYDLPEGWEWCRLGEIALLISGRDLEPSSYNNQQRGIPYITGASNLIGDDLDINRWTENPIVISQKGDILLSCKGTIGKTLFNSVGNCHIARQIMAIRPIFTHILPQYISIMLETSIEYFVEQARSIIPGISRKDILNLVVAVPPLAEQQRIVEKVDELMTLCDELKAAYTIPVVPSSHNNIILFPATKKEEETLLAARGNVRQLSHEAMQAIDDLFAEDEE